MGNIGHAFVKLGQYGDAAKAFEHLLEQTPVRVRQPRGEEAKEEG